jgi:hypothetical protein
MYKHGKPIYRFGRRPLSIIIGTILIILLGLFFGVILPSAHRNSLQNNNSPLVSQVKVSTDNTVVDEPNFSFSLPGKWTLASKDWDARYHAWMWQQSIKDAAGRWFRVYQDTIPADQAYNYLLPVTGEGSGLTPGQMSGKCSDFTTTQAVRLENGTFAAPSKWQQVSFLCDYANQASQTVGTSSTEGINIVSLTGTKGTHKYFFIYSDNNFSPDYGLMSAILSTFKSK